MKIAVGFIHGIGKQHPDFHKDMAIALKKRFAKVCPGVELVTEGIYWADITERFEQKLHEKMEHYNLGWDHFLDARGFMISFVGDAIAYQHPSDKIACNLYDNVYEEIHERFAQKLHQLARSAGGEAPLCLIAHSLGTIITSNYLYDLQNVKLCAETCRIVESGNTPLERGETLTHLYTMGSPLALWSMRFEEFGKPIAVPAPNNRRLKLPIGEWVNFYDKNDVMAYPLKTLNQQYAKAVTADVEVNNPGLLSGTPLGAHGSYHRSKQVLERIVNSLVKMSIRMKAQQEIAAALQYKHPE